VASSRGALVVLQSVALLALLAWAVVVWSSSVSARPAAANHAAANHAVAEHDVADTVIPAAPMPLASAVAIASRVDPGWLQRVAGATGIPSRALAAYAGASLALAAEKPRCHVGWSTLAAIGHIESDDGRHGGAIVSDNGYSSLPIIGPALDGGAFAGIHDSDGGAWDGDAVWDHAVGAFQFIPQTWRTWGSDGNGDGQSDPNQLDDAALAAARYLCHAGDLSTVDGWRRAVLSYNHSERYVDEVARVANSL
jgi:membrane-bound lytic murein transglycosylase B